jgi:pSer/pThr/pTyr-binding forkhead associated (FHA) protein
MYGPPPGAGVNPFGPTSPPAEQGHPPPDPIAATAPAVAPVQLPPGKRELCGFLVTYQNQPEGSFFQLFAGRNLVGRQGAADGLDIPINDPTTSSNHAALHIDSASRSVQLEDLGSTNGTFINEEPLGPQGRREVRDGDRIRFGGYTTVLKVAPRV